MLNPFSLIEALFSPAAQHQVEEQRRQEHGRVDEESGEPGRGPIDLDSGQVRIDLTARREPDPAGTGPGLNDRPERPA